MKKDTVVITHFGEPNWPVVNKLSGITKCLGVEMTHCADPARLETVLAQNDHRQVLFFTDEKLVTTIQSFEAQKKMTHVEVAMFINSAIPKVAETISNLSSVKYLIGIDSVESYGRDLSILIKKFTEGNILDLEKYLAFGCLINERDVTSYASKRDTVDSVSRYISNLGDDTYAHPFHEYARRVSEMVDEMLINAIFDANPRLRSADRSKPFELDDQEKIHVAWGYDGEYFGVSVRDPFGKFACDTIMKYVGSKKEAETLVNLPSAGLGLKLIFEKAHKVITNVKKQSVTEVIVLVRFESRMLEFEKRKKSFYYFSDEEDKNKKVI